MPARFPGPIGGDVFKSTSGPTGRNDYAEILADRGEISGEFPYEKTPTGCVATSLRRSRRKIEGLAQFEIWSDLGVVIFRVPRITIDLDGAPDTYHPPVYPAHWDGKGNGLGKDTLLNAAKNWRDLIKGCNSGTGGWCVKKNPHDWAHAEWVGIQTDASKNPIVRATEPFKGFYVPRIVPVWADALEHPWVVKNPLLEAKVGVHLGNSAVVIANGERPKVGYGMVADSGNKNSLGEMSLAMLNQLGMTEKSDDRGDFIVLVFASKQDTAKRTKEEIIERAQVRFDRWGGLENIDLLFPSKQEYERMSRDFHQKALKLPGGLESHRRPVG